MNDRSMKDRRELADIVAVLIVQQMEAVTSIVGIPAVRMTGQTGAGGE